MKSPQIVGPPYDKDPKKVPLFGEIPIFQWGFTKIRDSPYAKDPNKAPLFS